MNRFDLAIILSLILSSFSLGIGFLWADRVEISLLIIAINILLWLGFWSKLLWSSHLMLMINAFFICLGIFASIPTWILLVAMIGVIAYWDLNGFLIRVNQLKNSQSLNVIKELHLRRLIIVLISGGLISWYSLLITVPIDFLTAVLVSVFSVVGLGLAVRFSAKIN